MRVKDAAKKIRSDAKTIRNKLGLTNYALDAEAVTELTHEICAYHTANNCEYAPPSREYDYRINAAKQLRKREWGEEVFSQVIGEIRKTLAEVNTTKTGNVGWKDMVFSNQLSTPEGSNTNTLTEFIELINGVKQLASRYKSYYE